MLADITYFVAQNLPEEVSITDLRMAMAIAAWAFSCLLIGIFTEVSPGAIRVDTRWSAGVAKSSQRVVLATRIMLMITVAAGLYQLNATAANAGSLLDKSLIDPFLLFWGSLAMATLLRICGRVILKQKPASMKARLLYLLVQLILLGSVGACFASYLSGGIL